MAAHAERARRAACASTLAASDSQLPLSVRAQHLSARRGGAVCAVAAGCMSEACRRRALLCAMHDFVPYLRGHALRMHTTGTATV
eukprot:4576894-Pleurochrysis_carterae.AAC.1